ncbi:hypothetical protein FJZ53_00625 [Candidatus Woesearchaeota archaeon]|nr:hypothetical protein [Candidatus Woesearchaeota archaeon]
MKKGSLLNVVLASLAAGSILVGAYTLPNYYKNDKDSIVYKNDKDSIVNVISIDRPSKTFKKYGKNITYFDFSQMNEQMIPKEEVPLPKDLEGIIKKQQDTYGVKDHEMFSDEFYAEAAKLGYDREKLGGMSAKDAIKAITDIVVSRITYCDVDKSDNWFAKKHGRFINSEYYFHYGFGDCDKYRNATINAFEMVKAYNPNLKNVYLSNEDLGGSMKGHAWVSVMIPQKESLMISHIDPTFYDDGEELDASKDEYDAHVLVYNDAFKAYFYKYLKEYEVSYDIFKDALSKTQDIDTLEDLLNEMCCAASWIDDHDKAIGRVEWAREEYESKGFTKNLDDVLYFSYRTYSDAGKKAKAEEYKQRLLKEYPDSYWTELINKGYR